MDEDWVAVLLMKVATTIAEIESKGQYGEKFIPTRYPYTYGWDYARSHASEMDWLDDAELSRASVGDFFHKTLGLAGATKAATMLADAYLREHHLTMEAPA